MFGQRFSTSEITSSAVTFQFSVNTAATGANEKKAAFPLNLYGQDGASVIVNWGDGNTETLTSADYTATDSTASVHEYASAGEYTVTVTSGTWESIYLLSCYVDGAITSTNNANLPIYIWRRTLTAVESPLPPVKGVKKLAAVDATAMTASDNDLGYLFHRCEKMTSIPANTFVLCSHITVLTAIFYHCSLMTTIPVGLLDPLVNAVDLSQFFRYWIALTSVPEGLFDKCVNVVNMQETFRYCQTLETIPEGLFRYNTLVTNMLGMFRVCNMLKNFKLCIGSPSVNTVSDFIVNASNVTRIVCVPANSTTYTTFNSYKNTSNNIIVSTDLDDCIQVDSGEEPEEWQFTVDTEATASGEKKTGIPFNLYGQTGIELTVDWGDNTTSTLTSSDYTSSDATASVHEYANAGEYTVTVVSNNWKNTYLLFCNSSIYSVSNIITSLYWFRRTAISIDTKLPQIKGVTDADIQATYNNSLRCLFCYLEKLTSIPSELFDNNTAVTSFNSCFWSCTSLQSIPSELFANNTAATSFEGCFYVCSSLQSIPAGLFDKNTAVTTFRYCFRDCTSLQSIPSGLFDKNTAVTNFDSCFYNCTSLQSIPSGLFDNNTAVTDFSNCFWNCTSLQSIPSGLFDKNTAVTSFYYCFSFCTNLLNFHLKIGSSSVANFSSFVPNASNVDRILCVPANSTTYTKASSFANSSNGIIVSTDYIDCAETWEFTIDTEATTTGEKKTGIPFNLYGQTGIELLVDWGDNTTSTLTPSDYTTSDSTASVHTYAIAGEYTVTVVSNNWENTYLLYYNGTIPSYSNTKTSSLYWFRRTATSIDTKLPQTKGVTNANTLTAYNNSLQGLFYNSNKITSIPAGLFDNNTAVTDFQYCFRGCSSLTFIPSGLFDKNVAVTTFYGCFWSCTSLQSIPSGLFDKNTAVTDFSYCFCNCSSSSLQSIPSGLFDKNTAVTDFNGCFENCTSLQSIPTGLFDNNTAVTNFSYCFRNCSSSSLQSIPSGLFDKNTSVTSFQYCFSDCTSLQSIPSGLFDKNTRVTSFNYCFSYCTSLQSIPSGLFDKNTAVTDFSYCFYDCTSLASISSRLFDKNIRVTTFEGCFWNCTYLRSIPSGLFDKNTAVTDFSYCFYGCTNLLNFHLKIGSSSVANFSSFISDASNVDRIICVPANSTTYTNASNFANASNGVIVSTDIIDCAETWEFTIDTEATASGEKKTGIPFNLYGQTGIELLVDWGDNTTSRLSPSDYTSSDATASIHEYASAGEYTVTVISNDWENTYLLFYDYSISSNSNTKTSLLYWFRRTATNIDTKLPQIKGVADADTLTTYNNSLKCLFIDSNKITSIPSGLFDNNTAVTIFNSCFSYCSSLQSIPSGLFDNNTLVTSFRFCFEYCSSLQSIPTGLFDKNTAVTSFQYCFSYCSLLQSIPSGLFDKNTAVTDFASCFQNCISLQSIPSGLFDKNTAVTDFSYCFKGCTSLASIPSGLFDNNTVATDFSGSFFNCTSLQSIPAGLFDKNTAVTNFARCFSGCTLLADFTLNIGSSLVTSASGFVTLNSGTTRTINVPANSATYTAFSNVASSLGLTIVGV